MEYADGRSVGEIIERRRNIILKNADAATTKGFAMLLSYAWQKDYCYPGQKTLAEDLGLTDRSVRTHLKALEAIGLLSIKRVGQGKNNLYELDLKPRRL